MKTNRFLSAAIFALAITFTFSCSSDDGGSGGDGSSSSVTNGGKEKSSSSSLGLSSSDGTGISSSGDKGASSSSAGGGYKTVKIGNQTWMAENLNIATGGKCYDGKSTNCNKYGRLYDWETAKSVCPSGWHLPTNEEWETLIGSLGGEETAGTKLKSANGFAALPSGYGNSDGDFSDAEEYGYWWSATENDEDYAWHWKIDYEYEEVSNDYDDKSKLYSVRCVQNTQNVKSSSSGGKSSSSGGGSSSPSGGSSSSVNKGSSSSSIAGDGSSSSKGDSSSSSSDDGIPVKCPNAVIGNNTLSCGGQTYKTVVIGGKTWMAENMNYAVENSVCYDKDPANCVKYGRLYNRNTAEFYACPEGWHLSSPGEWDALGSEAAKLKAKEGWPIYKDEEGTTDYNGTDDYGFAALPGGAGSFSNIGVKGYWHTSGATGGPSGSTILTREINYSNPDVFKGSVGGGSESFYNQIRQSTFHSVRCVKD